MRISVLNRLSSFRSASVVGALISPVVNHRLVPYPFVMNFVTTRRCNSRCRMCHIWQQKDLPDLSLAQIRHIFARDKLSFIRSIALTGGEPTLRADLADLFRAVTEGCPNLEHVYLSTNGLNVQRTLDCTRHIIEIIEKEAGHVRRFDVQVSLDGVGRVHDRARGIPGCFERVVETLDGLQELQRKPLSMTLRLRLSCVVTPDNLPHLNDLCEFAAKRELYVQYSPAVLSGEYYRNLDVADQVAFMPGKSAAAVRFFERLAAEDKTSLRFYYRDVSYMLRGHRRRRRCMMGFYDFVLEHDGQVYPCVNCEHASFGNLLEQPFEKIWFGHQATEGRRNLRKTCCPECVSMCYLAPANPLEVAKLGWSKVRTEWRHRVGGSCGR